MGVTCPCHGVRVDIQDRFKSQGCICRMLEITVPPIALLWYLQVHYYLIVYCLMDDALSNNP